MRAKGYKMRNVFLETMLLKLLHEQRSPMSFSQLMDCVDMDVAQPYLTRDELLGTIRRLEDLELIEEQQNLLGYERFSLTEKGEHAFDDTVFGVRGRVRVALKRSLDDESRR